MNMKTDRWKYLWIVLIAMTLAGDLSAQQERKYIRQGNREYSNALGKEGYVDTVRMQKAESSYRKALDKDLQSFQGGFNLGAALFKQQKFDEAALQYQLLIDNTTDKKELAEVYYNLGNSKFAGGKLEESIEAYKQSLRNNPADTAAKYNLAVAQKLLKENPQQQQQNGDNSQNQDQQQDQQQQENQDQQQQQDQQQNQDQQAGKQEEKEGEEKEMQQAEPKDQMSKEDAERLLQMLMQEEKKVLDKLQQEKSKQRPKKLDKDW
jgi:Ca-activated chloride channel homolog